MRHCNWHPGCLFFTSNSSEGSWVTTTTEFVTDLGDSCVTSGAHGIQLYPAGGRQSPAVIGVRKQGLGLLETTQITRQKSPPTLPHLLLNNAIENEDCKSLKTVANSKHVMKQETCIRYCKETEHPRDADQDEDSKGSLDF